MNVFERKLENKPVTETRTIHSSDLLPGVVKQRHIQPNALLIFKGLSADRPSGSSEVGAYFATDTGVLSIWSGSAWLDVTLS